MSVARPSLATLRRADASAEARVHAIAPPRRPWLTRVVVPVAILATAAGLLAYQSADALAPAATVRAVPAVVRAGVAGVAEGEVVTQAPGWIEPNPFATNVSALAEGAVSEVLVLEGQTVAPQQVVARLIDADAHLALDRADAALAQRHAEVLAAEAELTAAEQNLRTLIEPRRALAVSEAALAEAQRNRLALAAEIAAERARAAEAEDQHARLETLKNTRAIAESEVVQHGLRLDAQKAVLEATEARAPVLEALVTQREAEASAAREALELKIEPQRAVRAARAALENAHAAVHLADAERAEAALKLERMSVRSPVGGVVIARLVEPGSRVMIAGDNMMSAVVVRLYDPQRLQVRADVPLADAAKVGVGQRAEIFTDALPDRAMKGVVNRLVHEANIQKNTVQVKVAIEDPPPELRPEMLARVKFFAAAPAAGAVVESIERVCIPRDALIDASSDGGSVFVVDAVRGVAQRRAVKLGGAAGEGWVEALDGIRPGDRLIVRPGSDLRDGARIRVIDEGEGA